MSVYVLRYSVLSYLLKSSITPAITLLLSKNQQIFGGLFFGIAYFRFELFAQKLQHSIRYPHFPTNQQIREDPFFLCKVIILARLFIIYLVLPNFFAGVY